MWIGIGRAQRARIHKYGLGASGASEKFYDLDWEYDRICEILLILKICTRHRKKTKQINVVHFFSPSNIFLFPCTKFHGLVDWAFHYRLSGLGERSEPKNSTLWIGKFIRGLNSKIHQSSHNSENAWITANIMIKTTTMNAIKIK